MRKCRLNTCKNKASKEFKFNAESYTTMEFHLVGPFYKFCSDQHMTQWKEENKASYLSA